MGGLPIWRQAPNQAVGSPCPGDPPMGFFIEREPSTLQEARKTCIACVVSREAHLDEGLRGPDEIVRNRTPQNAAVQDGADAPHEGFKGFRVSPAKDGKALIGKKLRYRELPRTIQNSFQHGIGMAVFLAPNEPAQSDRCVQHPNQRPYPLSSLKRSTLSTSMILLPRSSFTVWSILFLASVA